MNINKNLIFFGGTILTMDKEERAEAVAIRGGKIVEIGTLEYCESYFGDEVVEKIDLMGKSLLPGFIDPHAHLMMLGMCHTWIDISYPKVKNIQDLLNVLSEYKEAHPEETIIRGFGFDQRNLEERRYPKAEELDQVAKDRGVQIMHVSGHCNVVNSYMLDKLNIHPDSETPKGGMIGKDKNGQLNGQLFDTANNYFAQENGVEIGSHGPNIHMPDTPENLQTLITAGQNECLASGITTINDPQVTKQEMESYQTAKEKDHLKIRVVMSFLSSYMDELIKLGFQSKFRDDQLSIGSIKLYADGSLNSGTAYLSTSYKDSEKKSGYLYHSPEEFKRLFVKAHTQGFQTITHAQGDGAIQVVIDAAEEAEHQHPYKGRRHRIEHCGLPAFEQIEKIKNLKLFPVPQPQHVMQFGEGVVRAVGDYGRHYSPYGWFQQFDIPVVLSSDAPVAPPYPMEAIYAAVTRKTVHGTTVGEGHKITLTEALQGYTIEAAKALHLEDKVGSITKGKYADLAVLDKNPYELKEEDLKDCKVVETWVNGERVY
ncbi:amidohydrolase [Salibacterium aidingense]|uniref:amidohydrolase n=1 Tax=Salibacterium aidingense TaxID=384933 RepID=UPI00040FF097|nr:amidohydrolase [Salibacterium aidingense]